MVTVRRMEERDIKAAARLEAENFSVPWSEQAYADTLLCDYAYYFVAEEGREVIGVCGLRNIAGEGEITNVVVSEPFRRRGTAGMLLETVLTAGAALGIEDFTLEVRCGNRPAICLYEKFGFKNEGIRRNFYDKPKEDAIIMWRRKG